MLSALLLAHWAPMLATWPQDGQGPLGPAPIDRSPRLRRTLTNGASVGAERRPKANRIVFQAVIANLEGDHEAAYGYRHLLEHLIAARDPDLDRKLEAIGGVMGATTGREVMRFWISVPPEGLTLGFDAMKTLLKSATLNTDDVARERRIVGREVALLTTEERANVDAWTRLYGVDGRDPVGVATTLDDATTETLERLWRGMLIGPRLSLFVAGPIELDATVDRLERFARAFPDGPRPGWTPRPVVLPGAGSSAGTYALAVGPIDERATLAALATGLALASEVEGSSIAYTPSPRGGAVVLANPAAADELKTIVHRGDTGLRNRALNLARAWLASRTDDPENSSETRATLAAFRAGLVPERLVAVLAEVREPDLDAAFARWKALAP